MFKKSLVAAAAALFAFSGANADIIDLSGSTSEGLFGEGSNTVVVVNLDAGSATVAGFAWTLSFEAFSPSWGSEARIDVTAPDGTLFTFSGSGDAGWGNSSGIFVDGGDTTAFNGLAFSGDWTFRFYEDFNDGATDPDGIYHEAFFLIKPIPAPATLALLGAAGLIGRRRRRS